MNTSLKPTTRYDKAKSRRFYFVIIAGVIALALLCGLGIWIATETTNAASQSINNETSTFTFFGEENTAEDDITTEITFPNKLEGATETVDEDGIVHGTTEDGINYTVHGRGETSLEEGIVSLAAVGDQIGTANSLPIAQAYASAEGESGYDFTGFYQEVGPAIQEYDLRYINQETVMAGNDNGYSYTGYPTFNTPDSAAEAIAEYNFNLVNFATNHIYDLGTYGVEQSHEVWDQYPELIVAGSYLSQEERETVQMIERNGITFAFLAYTYGDNSYLDAASMPNSYYNCAFDKDAMTEDIERAQQVADVVIVSMHWGSEYTVTPNDQQYEYAEFLADLDVDLVIGTHAHSMQPVQYITGETGNTIPVVFGLGDFISGWTLTNTILSGMFTCDFVQQENGDIEIENLAWYPLIEWSDGGDTYVRFLANMDEDTINANTRTSDVSNDYDYLVDFINSSGMEIPVIM